MSHTAAPAQVEKSDQASHRSMDGGHPIGVHPIYIHLLTPLEVLIEWALAWPPRSLDRGLAAWTPGDVGSPGLLPASRATNALQLAEEGAEQDERESLELWPGRSWMGLLGLQWAHHREVTQSADSMGAVAIHQNSIKGAISCFPQTICCIESTTWGGKRVGTPG